MALVTVHDKTFRPYLSAETIAARVRLVAEDMGKKLAGQNPLFLCVLNGSFVFAADLLRCFDFPCEISFVKLASYSGTSSTGAVKQLIGLNEDLRGRVVVVLEDIIDTGVTMQNIIKQLYDLQAEKVVIATCFFKPTAFKGGYEIDYRVFDIEDLFVIGYGMDYDGYGRNLPALYQLMQ